MNNEGKLVERIIEDAKEQAKDIIDIAQKDAEEIMNKAMLEAESIKLAGKKEAETLVEDTKNRAKIVARANAQRKILAKKQSLLKQCIDEANKSLLSMDDESYKKLIENMLLSSGLDGGELILSTKDRQRFGQDFLLRIKARLKGFRLSDETRNIQGGFIVKIGDIEYNYSFDSIFATEHERLLKIAAENLSLWGDKQ